MISKIHHVLVPLDVEILERAFDEASAAFKGCATSIESDCDQALEAALHRELIEIAKLYGVTESDTLRRLARIGMHREPFPSIASDHWDSSGAPNFVFQFFSADSSEALLVGPRP